MYTQLVTIMRRLLRLATTADPAVKSQTIIELGDRLKEVLGRFARAVKRAGESRKARRMSRVSP